MPEITATHQSDRIDRRPTAGRDLRILSVLLGLAAVLVLLQGLWAGLFLSHSGEGTTADGWMDIHARGADLTVILALAATIWAFLRIRDKRELWLAAAGLTVLLVLEAYLGGRIRDDNQDSLTAIHVPLAMAMMARVVWLPLRARALRARG